MKTAIKHVTTLQTWIVLFLLTLSFNTSFSQSLNGNVASIENNAVLQYGTVDIYQGKNLVSSVLTDREGNFNVDLDTGTYRCEVRFSGCKPVIRNINVKGDMNSDFKLKGKPKLNKFSDSKDSERSKSTLFGSGKLSKSHKIGRTETSEVFNHSKVRAPVLKIPVREMITDGKIAPPPPLTLGTDAYRKGKGVSVPTNARAGVLTGGEVNDFAKLKFWDDLVEKEMNTYKNGWKLGPSGRYTLQLMDQNGIPLADAKVKLSNDKNQLLYLSRTDNSGQCELWNSTIPNVNQTDVSCKIEVNYKGRTQTIRKAKTFDKGLNYMELEIKNECEQSQNVDIAFVIDATGSMGDEIDFLKKELNEIIFQSKIINPDLNFRFANTFYRDRGEAYLVRQQNFTRILSESANFIGEQGAAGGGDYEEAVEIAMDSAISHLNWSETARTRILFLVLDAPPHNTEQNRKKLDKLMRQAAAKGIRIIPLAASGINKSTEYLMRCLSLGTNGTYLYISNHSGVGNKHIEPSADSLQVETISSLMTRVISNYVFMPKCDQTIPDLPLNYPDSVVAYTPESDSIPTSDSVSVDVVQSNFEWSFYPNPNFGMLNIKANADIDELYLTDMNGKILQIIRRIESGQVKRVNLSNYASGVYLLRYPKKDKFISGKIILVRNS